MVLVIAQCDLFKPLPFQKKNSELAKGRYRLFTPVKDNDLNKELGTLAIT